MKLACTTIGLFLFLTALGCGGGSGGGNSAGSIGGTTPAASSGAVTVNGGSTVTGADITVPAAPSQPLNALVLGVADINSGGGSASNTGATVARGSQARVLMFGPGLNGNVRVTISGPNDITVNNIQSITSTKGTPGVEFVIGVSAGAAVGARTVFLTNPSGNATAFSGGLEIQ